jgi:hypothetical protein
MKEEFITYEQALALKELGFDEPCLMYIDDEEDLINDDTAEWIGAVKAPLKQQVFRWFREKHNLWFRPDFYDEMKTYDYQGSVHKLGRFSSLASLDNYKTVEELESACIDKLIEIVKNK